VQIQWHQVFDEALQRADVIAVARVAAMYLDRPPTRSELSAARRSASSYVRASNTQVLHVTGTTSTGISRNILTERLTTLVEGEVLSRSRYQDRPARYEYLLTERGRELLPVLVALMQWGDKWMPGRPEQVAVHGPAQHPVRAVLTCAECGEVEPADGHFRQSVS